jgi:hypothetical protein
MKKSFRMFLFSDTIPKKLFIFFFWIENYVNRLTTIPKIRNKEVVLVHVSRNDVEEKNFTNEYFFSTFLADVPQKRVDRQRSTEVSMRPNSSTGAYRSSMVAQLTEGSPLVPRRQLYTNIG